MNGRACGFLLCAAAFGAEPWETRGFDAFRRGEIEPGADLYVSRRGILETTHRWDLNNDGVLDLVFNNTHDLAYVVPSYRYRFRPKSRIGPTRHEYPGAGAVRMISAELNGDGFPELIVARGFDNSTRVLNSWIYWGTAGGWSSRYHIELSTPYVQDVCVADLNRDSRPDLVFIQSGAHGFNTSYIYWGREDGYRYPERSTFDTPGANGCLAADLDRDGILDLVVTGSKTVVYWGGDLRTASGIPFADSVGARMLGDRLALASSNGPRILSLNGRTFHLDQEIDFEGAGRVAAADLNADGSQDLVVTRAVSGRVWETTSRIYWGKAGKFEAKRFTELPAPGAVDAAVADMDGDGHVDVAFACSRNTSTYDIDSYIYWGAATGFDANRRTALPTHGVQSVHAAGRDLLFANSLKGRPAGDIDTYIYLGAPGGGYSRARRQKIPTVGGYENCTADFDDDGYNDLLLLGSHEGDLGSPLGSQIYWGAPDGLSPARRTEVPTRGAIGCATGDLDGDGYLDLVFSNMEDDTAQILFGGPNRFASPRQVNRRVQSPRFPAIADLNKDGYPDLLVPSVKLGVIVFWGSPSGLSAEGRTVLDGIGSVSEQVADLDADGWLDIIVLNLMDIGRWFYQGIHSYIYWGSPQGYSAMRRTDLPSSGAHHATVADFNRDGSLDIFISNYQSEYTRSIDSYVYWGDRGSYAPERRLALHNESAAGVVSADLDGDGWVDLAVSNHVRDGDHHTESLVFWNRNGRFDPRETTALPTIGPHMMTGVDPGNLYTRAMEYRYISEPHDAGSAVRIRQLSWEGATPFGSSLAFEVRGAQTREALPKAVWSPAERAPSNRWWQYRAVFRPKGAAWPAVSAVRISFGP